MKIIKWFAFCFAFLCFSVVLMFAYVEARLAKTQIEAMQAVSKWGDRIFRLACVILRIRVDYDLPARRATSPPCVLLSNHTSFFDFLAMLTVARHCGLNVCWVVKREVMDYPFIGWMAAKQACIAVHRDGRSSDREDVDRGAREAMAAGASLLIFAEGTRTPELVTPKQGGFIRAQAIYGPALSVTIGWHPKLGAGGRAKLVRDGVDLFGRRMLLHARDVPASEAKLDGFLDKEWSFKRVIIKAWQQEKDSQRFISKLSRGAR